MWALRIYPRDSPTQCKFKLDLNLLALGWGIPWAHMNESTLFNNVLTRQNCWCTNTPDSMFPYSFLSDINYPVHIRKVQNLFVQTVNGVEIYGKEWLITFLKAPTIIICNVIIRREEILTCKRTSHPSKFMRF
jgi:hypothetical protein